jgi:hypothetical protein
MWEVLENIITSLTTNAEIMKAARKEERMDFKLVMLVMAFYERQPYQTLGLLSKHLNAYCYCFAKVEESRSKYEARLAGINMKNNHAKVNGKYEENRHSTDPIMQLLIDIYNSGEELIPLLTDRLEYLARDEDTLNCYLSTIKTGRRENTPLATIRQLLLHKLHV